MPSRAPGIPSTVQIEEVDEPEATGKGMEVEQGSSKGATLGSPSPQAQPTVISAHERLLGPTTVFDATFDPVVYADLAGPGKKKYFLDRARPLVKDAVKPGVFSDVWAALEDRKSVV